MLYRDCVVHHSFEGERSGGAQLIVRLGTRTAGRRRTTSRCLAGAGAHPPGGVGKLTRGGKHAARSASGGAQSARQARESGGSGVVLTSPMW